MIRKDGCKLIVYPHVHVMRLYNMKNDPQKINDLVGEKKFASKEKELFEDLIVLQKDMGDQLDLLLWF